MVMDGFLKGARVKAERRVIQSGGRPFAEIIRSESADAALTLVGLRRPELDETVADYAAYFAALTESLKGVSPAAFVLAAEDVDFRSMFADANFRA